VPDARAPDLLRAYLADRDVPCHACGYNLRNATDFYCPECGAVIPRPPAEFAARARTDPADLRLACRACGYWLSGVNAQRCPECGSNDLETFRGDSPPPRRRGLRWAPSLLIGLAGLGLIISLTCIAVGLMRTLNAPKTAARLDAWLGAAGAMVPVVIVAAWFRWRPVIARLEPGERKLVAATAAVIGILALVLAVRALR
jgi:predicted RNA-binding Zn-ribbon protein involved in translation (DUF1610 family)